MSNGPAEVKGEIMHHQFWIAVSFMVTILVAGDRPRPRWALPAMAVLSAGLVANVAWEQSWIVAVAVGSCLLLAFAVALKRRQRGTGNGVKA